MKRAIIFLAFAFLVLACIGVFSAYAEEKNWTGFGDSLQWHEADNWSPSSVPGLTSEVEIDSEDVDITITQTFNAKSITLGGGYSSSLTSRDFVYGTIAPDNSSESAILTRKNGHIILKGPGIVTLRGSYTDSEEELESQPSFLFWVE